MLKQSNRVHIIATIVDFVTEYQNLNSGNLLMNGLNSSFDLVGNSGPSPSNFISNWINFLDKFSYIYIDI